MTKRLGRQLLGVVLAGCAIFAAGCASTDRTMVGRARPAIDPAAVRVYEREPRRFESIAIIEGKTINELRIKAAAVGANGLLSRGVISKPGPVIGFGIGTSSLSVGRRSAVGVGTGVSFATPLRGGEVLQADAIYVP
ncbi:MAG TPA: hypothetical protein VK993_12390 [Chthoniobacterales bacterium]|nr:hypothetical protein [Chthoniobacterales bacterium]